MRVRKCNTCHIRQVHPLNVPLCMAQSLIQLAQIALAGGCSRWHETLAAEDRAFYVLLCSVLILACTRKP